MSVTDFALTGLTTILAWLFVITVVITVHELGHFWAARFCRVKIERFSLGFGPTLFMRKSKKTGVEWRLAALPLGGYVKFAGDPNVTGVPDAEDLAELKSRIIETYGPGAERAYYHFKPVWQRAIIAAAGPFANFLLATAIFAAAYSLVGDITYPTRIESVEANSPAAAAGLKAGDQIVRANGEEILKAEDFVQVVRLNAESAVTLSVLRDGRPLDLTVTPSRALVTDPVGNRTKAGRVGVNLALPRRSEVTIRKYGPLEAIGHGAQQCVSIVKTTAYYIGRIFTGKESGDQLSGPIGTAAVAGKLTSEAAKTEGDFGLKAASVMSTLVTLVALFSVGVGFLNLLPIPVLDGGHLLFYAYESVARKPLAARVQEVGYQVGLALVVGLMLFATWNDLQKLLLGGHSS